MLHNAVLNIELKASRPTLSADALLLLLDSCTELDNKAADSSGESTLCLATELYHTLAAELAQERTSRRQKKSLLFGSL